MKSFIKPLYGELMSLPINEATVDRAIYLVRVISAEHPDMKAELMDRLKSKQASDIIKKKLQVLDQEPHQGWYDV